MDEAVQRFRRQARRELGDRSGAERRYSDRLRHEAVTYWRACERQGEGLGAVATALGIAPMSLRRWAQDGRFRAVQVVADVEPVAARVIVIVGVDSVRIEGLDVETAAQLVTRLR